MAGVRGWLDVTGDGGPGFFVSPLRDMKQHLKKSDERVLVTAGGESRFWRVARWGIAMLPLLWVLMAAGELSAAHRLVTHHGHSFWQLIGLWYAPDAAETYTGLELLAVKRVEAAMWRLIVASVFGGFGVAVLMDLRRKKRLYLLLRSNGLIDRAQKQENPGRE